MTISPPEYVRVAEIAAKHAVLDHATEDDFITAIRSYPIYMHTNTGPVAIDGRLLASLDGRLLFVSPREWIISPFHPFVSGAWTIAADYVIEGGYEDLRQHYAAMALTLVDRYGDDFPKATGGLDTESIYKAGEDFDGFLLYLTRSDAEKMMATLFEPPKPLKMSQAQAIREWKANIASHEGETPPNKAEREAWGKTRGISRQRVRDLQEEYSPESWKTSGHRSNEPGG